VDESDVSSARQRIRELAPLRALPEGELARFITAVSEVVRNVVVHAGRGELVLTIGSSEGRRAAIVVVSDDGPGIADPEAALRDGYSSAGGLGLGLPSARRLVDAFELSSTWGVGTVVTLTKWLPDIL
jgi:serine/threonine-protein kinase RsbT